MKKQKRGYSNANFRTTGGWLIPWLIGYSKSVVSFGSFDIGIMYTLHITPYFNVGFTNPKPKNKPKSDQIETLDFDTPENVEEISVIDELLMSLHEDFIYSPDSDPRIISISFNNDEQCFIFHVTSVEVELPENIEEFPVVKVLY